MRARKKSRASSTSCAPRSRPRWPRCSKRSSPQQWSVSMRAEVRRGSGGGRLRVRRRRPPPGRRLFDDRLDRRCGGVVARCAWLTRVPARSSEARPACSTEAGRSRRLAVPGAWACWQPSRSYLLFDIGRRRSARRSGRWPVWRSAAWCWVLVGSQLTFLSYGTTARSARHFGAGDRTAARRGRCAGDLAGAESGRVGHHRASQATAVPLVSAVGRPADRDHRSGFAVGADRDSWVCRRFWCRLAGNGWMRGVQDTVRPLRYVVAGFAVLRGAVPAAGVRLAGIARGWELAGSAVANLVGQWLAALLFGGACSPSGCRCGIRPRRAACPGRHGPRSVRCARWHFRPASSRRALWQPGSARPRIAAHQVVLQLWNFLALVLDSLAIAAQSLVGAALGAGRAGARQVGRMAGDDRSRRVAAAVLAAIFAVGASVLPARVHRRSARCSTRSGCRGGSWWPNCRLPESFSRSTACLLGAGDAKFMRNATAHQRAGRVSCR